MVRYILSLTILFFVFALIACGPTASEPAETPAAAETDAQPDPTVVDPDHYKTEFENEKVRIVRITYGPGETSVMHYHPDSVAVYLTDIETEMELPDGAKSVGTNEAGKHSFDEAGMHLPTNVGEGPVELVLIELKSTAQEAADEGGADPTEVDADHYTAEFENDRVRVLRITYGAGETSTMHYHPDSVAVYLTDHKVSFEMPDGSTQESETKAGEHDFVEGGLHLPTNTHDQPWELILVELK